MPYLTTYSNNLFIRYHAVSKAMDVRLRIVLMGRTANSLNLQNYPLQEDQAPRQVHVMIRPGHFEALYTESQVGLMGGLPTTPEGEGEDSRLL